MQMSEQQALSANVTRCASPIPPAMSAKDPSLHDMLAPHMSVLTPGDADYEKELVSWNKDVVHRPAIIVQPGSTEDVCAAVKAAKAHNARVVIAGGRHGHDCLATDAVCIDMSRMTKVVVDAAKKLVTVEGGCRLGDMDRACAPHGLAAVTGTNPDTGVVGLSTAGGGGYLSRQYGMAVDNFVAAEVVLADGSAVLATKENAHADLLWGIAGAGSNFGLVTKLTMRLHPCDKVFGGMVINIAPGRARATRVLANWRDWITSAPRSVMSMAVLPCGAPVVPMAIVETDQQAVPQGSHATCTVGALPSLRGALGGPLTRLTGVLGKSFGALLSIKPLKRGSYHTELQPQLEAVQASGHYYDASCLVPALSDEVLATLVEFTRVRHVNKLASVIIFPMGGAISDAPVGSTAFWGGGRLRGAFWIIIEGKWAGDKDPDGAKRAAVVAWVKELRAALARFDVADTAHTLDGNMEAQLSGVRAIFGPNYEKAVEVKRRYDPTNFWTCNRNISPEIDMRE